VLHETQNKELRSDMDYQFGGLYPGLIAEVLSFYGPAKQILAVMGTLCQRFRSATFQMTELELQHRHEETSDSAIQYIIRNRGLRRLKLVSSAVTGKQIIEMIRSTSLVSLVVQFQSELQRTVDFGFLLPSEEPLQLTALKLHDVAANGTSLLLSKCPFLTSLEVLHCSDFADADVEGVVESMLYQAPGSQAAAGAAAAFSGGSAKQSTGTRLRRLVLSHLVGLQDTGLRALAGALSHCKLQHLSFAGCRNISHAGIQQAVSTCSSLLSLDISCVPLVSDAQAAEIVLSQGSLHQLALPPAAGAGTFRAMAQVAAAQTGFLALDTLQLRQCAGLHGSGGVQELAGLLAVLPQLRRLEITWTPGLTDFAVGDIAKSVPALRELVLDKCRRVSDRGATQALQLLPRLQLLSMRGSEATEATVEAAVQQGRVHAAAANEGVLALTQAVPRTCVVRL